MVYSSTLPFVASWKTGTRSYDPVPSQDEETSLAPLESKQTNTLISLKRTFLLNPSFWLTALAVLSIALTIRNLLVIQLRSPRISYLAASIGSPYIGLERLVRNESSPSWPLSSTHHPDFIGATEGPNVHHALGNGSVVRLDPERTVVIQHRVRDFGLEHCAVRVEFSRKSGNGHAVEHSARAYGHVGENPYFTLWRLHQGSEGNKAVLAPSELLTPLSPRKDFLGNITLDGMRQVQSSSFECTAGSIQTLEIALACTSSPCIMEFRLMQSPKRQGFWVIQSEEKIAPA